jgi:predicted ATPase
MADRHSIFAGKTMKYRESKLDKDLRQWFVNDYSKKLLRRISITEGTIRGLNKLDVSFDYPITAFAGVNGSGKSTILALACCAYHNNKKGFKLPKRKNSYYTYSDFFLQHTDEIPPQGIEIQYWFAMDNFAKTIIPDGKGVGYQTRKKSQGGKWNNYDSRMHKNVVFLGIERIVPHSERSQSRSYSKSFKNVALKGWEDKVKDAVGYILGKKYDSYLHLEHARYSLPVVTIGELTYSGFNMGAGENALFEIFSTIYSCKANTILVLDEIELGLHAKAQRLFMTKLKELCKETETQVICTTHSKEIFQCLPDEARYFIESVGGKTKVTPGISPDFAFSKLGAKETAELDLFVEDEVARALIQACLPSALRSRIKISVIGSATAIAKQLAALHIRGEERPTLAVFDGDQRALKSDNLNHARKMAENPSKDFEKWFSDRTSYLPGDTWPEAWIVQKCVEVPKLVEIALGLEEDRVPEVLEYGLQAGKHNEFFEISSHVGLEKNHTLQHLCHIIKLAFHDEMNPLKERIESFLD